jgi:hypothetical protein
VTAATPLSASVGCAAACRALDLPRASFYQGRAPRPDSDAIVSRPRPARALLSDTESQTTLVHLHSERFEDQAPHQVHAALLDEGIYVCSPRTMHRLVEQHGEVRERRDQLRRRPTRSRNSGHSAQSSPGWDITKTPRSGQVDLLLSLRHPRPVQSLCGWLDGGPWRECGTGQETHPGEPLQAGYCSRPAQPPRR